MARIRDLWFNARPGPDGERLKTAKHGRGNRWLVEYADPGGAVKTKTFGRKPDAESYLDNMKVDVRRGEYVDPKLGQTPFREVAERYWAGRYNLALKTELRDQGMVKRLVERFGDYPVNKLAGTPSELRAWFAGRRTPSGQPLAPTTVRKEMRILSAILEVALDDDMVRKNPMVKVRRPKRTRRKVEPWSLDTIHAIIDTHREDVRPLAALAFGAGLRQGEAFGVSPDDVDFLRRTLTVQRQVIRANGHLYFTPPKMDSTGVVHLDQELLDVLAAYLAEQPPREVTLPWRAVDAKPSETRTVRLLCTTRYGNAWDSKEYVMWHWRRAVEAAGVEYDGQRTGMHQLRHAFASYRLAEGMPITDVQHELRHATLEETVRTYAHRVPKSPGEQLVGAVAGVFRSAPVPPRSVSVPSGNASQ